MSTSPLDRIQEAQSSCKEVRRILSTVHETPGGTSTVIEHIVEALSLLEKSLSILLLQYTFDTWDDK